MLRMLLIGYAYGIRSERGLCSEVHLNLAYRWFCRLGLDGVVPDHSTFSKNRYGRFRESDIYRVLSRMSSENAEVQDWWAVRVSLLMEVPYNSSPLHAHHGRYIRFPDRVLARSSSFLSQTKNCALRVAYWNQSRKRVVGDVWHAAQK